MPRSFALGFTSPGPYAPQVGAFRQGLSEKGYSEGQNLAIEYRWAESRYDRLPALYADLGARKVDLIVTQGGSTGALAAKSATGRAGTGINDAELERVWRKLKPLSISKIPLDTPPPRSTRFGSPLVLSRVHWVRPELVAEVKFLTWTEDNLLRQVVYQGLRDDKPASEMRREAPRPNR